MHHIIFDKNTTYKVALLIKEGALDKAHIEKFYINPTSIPSKDIIAFSLKYNTANKAPAVLAKEYINNLLKATTSVGVTTLFVCDSTYFKYLTKVRKVVNAHGYIKKCAIKGYEHLDVILSVNYQGLFYSPNNQQYIDMSLHTLESHLQGTHVTLGQGIIHTAQYPETTSQIASALQELHKYPELTCDTEAFSLKFYKTGIGTIAFAWDEHNGIAFKVNYEEVSYVQDTVQHYAEQKPNPEIVGLLKNFFDTYQGKVTYHNANFDIKLMINDLYMDTLLDQKGMIEGINTLTKSFDDTKLITYLATNSTSGNDLKLKHLAHEFAGDYAEEDIEDIRKIPTKELLKYNLIDCLATWYVKKKYLPIMIADQQADIYENIMLPSIVSILQMELTGVPIDMEQVLLTERELQNIQSKALSDIHSSKNVAYAKELLEQQYVDEDFASRKAKAKNPDKIKSKDIKDIDIPFNVGSPKQLAALLYDVMELPIIDTTKTGLPSTSAKTIKKLLNHTITNNVRKTLENINIYTQTSTILSTFITAFKENSVIKEDGHWYLHGSYNLGGTVSGRMSSSQPNLQNIPSGSKYASLIKKCFIAPKGWLLAGADFDSLEDKISALTTRDENKLKVYEENYDGHCLRAYSYFGSQMPDIGNTVQEINSIVTRYPELRQASKGPTFALTYGGTFHTLINNLGIPHDDAVEIEKNYHILYKQSDEWVQAKLAQASTDGYVTVAFGLRVRTPILEQTLLGKKSTPIEASSEARTAGNALGQSYGLLNNRAANEFQQRVLASQYWDQIKPIMQIHDSMYFLVKNNVHAVKWFNDNLVDCMSWQKLSELSHPTVKITSAVDVFYPSWDDPIKIKNNATVQELFDIATSSRNK